MLPLPTEILVLIFSDFSKRPSILFQCSLVDRAFNDAASQLLYANVTYSPKFRAILDLRDKGELPQKSQLWSACLPRNAGYVQELVITGYLSTKSISLSTFSTTLAALVKSLPNLSSLELTPANYHDHVFVALFEELLSLHPNNHHQATESQIPSSTGDNPNKFPSLRSFTVNHSCTDEKTAPLLIALIKAASPHLSQLTVQSPTRVALNLLPDCLAGTDNEADEPRDTIDCPFPALRCLHFKVLYASLTRYRSLTINSKDNCGSITPGVLASLVSPRYIRSNIQEFTLGLSYSLTHDDVLKALSQLERLGKLQLQYYFQYKPFTGRPRLMHLTHFTVVHEAIQTPSQAQAFCKWARTIIDYSPLESLRLVSDQGPDEFNDNQSASSGSSEDEDPPKGLSGPAFDGLASHLAVKHGKTLKYLDMRHMYVGVRAARQLMVACVELRELRIAVRLQIVHTFCELNGKSKHLREVEFEIRNRRPSKKLKLINEELAKRVFEGGAPSLQVIWLDGVRFRRSKKVQGDSE